MHMPKMPKIPLILGVLLMAVALTACYGVTDQEQREINAQNEAVSGAQTIVGADPMTHYESALGIKFWRDTMNKPGNLWYVYRIDDFGKYYAYNICNTVPLSYGVSTTNPKKLMRDEEGHWHVVPAAGLDGVYWSGVDPSLYYCRDVSSGAMINFLSTKAEFYNQPLDLVSMGSDEVPLITFKVQAEPAVPQGIQTEPNVTEGIQ